MTKPRVSFNDAWLPNNIGLHQGSTLSSYHFTLDLEVLRQHHETYFGQTRKKIKQRLET